MCSAHVTAAGPAAAKPAGHRSAIEAETRFFTRLRERADTPGEQRLRLLVGVLLVAGQLGESFLEWHPDDCGCPFCDGERYIDGIREDVRGAAWAARTHGNLLSSDICSPLRPDGDSFAADLRGLADLAEDLDRMEDEAAAAGAGPDAGPVVVEGGAR